MKTKYHSKVIFHLSLLFVFCLLPVSRPTTVSAEEVVLNPGYIEGAIQVGSETIYAARISADSTDGEGFSAWNQIFPNAASGSYSLTVNVPEGTSIDYKVSALIWLDGYRSLVSFRRQTVPVNEFSSQIADFILQNPGFIKGNINVTGGTLSSAYLYAFPSSSTSVTHYTTSSDLTFPFPVEPGDNIYVYGYATLVSGARVCFNSWVMV